MKRNVETPTSRPVLRAGKPQGELWAERERMLEEAKAGCNEPDTGVMLGPKGSLRPAGAPVRENLENRLCEGKRWTAARAAGAPSISSWSAVNWKQVYEEVWRLQVRIAQAVREWFLSCWVGQPAFGVLEPCAGKLARRVLRGAGGR